MGLIFISIQSVCILWLVHLIHQHLRQLLIHVFLLAFSWWFWVCFCRSFLSLVFIGYVSPLSICCKAGLVVLNSLNFCLSMKLFISPSILNDIVARSSNLGCRFCSFSTLNISCHSLLACRVFTEKLAVNHMDFSLLCYLLLFPCCF